MRLFRSFFKWLSTGAAVAVLPLLCSAANPPTDAVSQYQNVALQYHFAGVTRLAKGDAIPAAKQVFALRISTPYKNLVLNRVCLDMAEALGLKTNGQTPQLFRPLLDSFLDSESMGCMGGAPGGPFNFVLAVHLDKDLLQTWQQNLKTANRDSGEELRAESFTGWQWNKGAGNSFWMVPAQDWMVFGRGKSLAFVRSDYLRQIQKTGRPDAALEFNCLESAADWPRLADWIPLSSCPLKLGRTQFAIAADANGFHLTGQIKYPEAIQWQAYPMLLPTNLVREPLNSFTTGQNVEPFLKSDETLSKFCTDPFSDQFYFWSMNELAFQNYAAWPSDDPTNTLIRLADQAPGALNPQLRALDNTKLNWSPKAMQLSWEGFQLIAPIITTVPAKDGSFLAAGLFPLTPGKSPAPQALWAQFAGRSDLVYYDWELTGPRVRQLLTVSQILPVLQLLGVGPAEPGEVVSGGVKMKPKTTISRDIAFRLSLQESWLASLTPLLGNTVTEVTKTGPNELTVVRNSPFVFSSLELILLSHVLTDTPAGPLDWHLLPQAKMSGPGLRSH